MSGRARMINCKLDRAFTNNDLITLLPDLQVVVLPSSSSDNSPLLISLPTPAIDKNNEPFRYSNNEHLLEGYYKSCNLSNSVTVDENDMYKLVIKLKAIKQSLKQWNNNKARDSDVLQDLQESCTQMQFKLEDNPFNPMLNDEY